MAPCGKSVGSSHVGRLPFKTESFLIHWDGKRHSSVLLSTVCGLLWVWWLCDSVPLMALLERHQLVPFHFGCCGHVHIHETNVQKRYSTIWWTWAFTLNPVLGFHLASVTGPYIQGTWLVLSASTYTSVCWIRSVCYCWYGCGHSGWCSSQKGHILKTLMRFPLIWSLK